MTDRAISMEDFDATKEELESGPVSCNELLKNASEVNFKSVLLAGVDANGGYRFFSNFKEPASIVFLLEAFKALVVDQAMSFLSIPRDKEDHDEASGNS